MFQNGQLSSGLPTDSGYMIIKREQMVEFNAQEENRVITMDGCVIKCKICDYSVTLSAETNCLKFIRIGLHIIIFKPT